MVLGGENAMKLCPYNRTVEQVNQTRMEYDENGNSTFQEHKLVETQAFSPCVEKRCGAWSLGRCRRR